MSRILLNSALQLISYTTIQGACFGINLSLYFLCIQLFYREYHKASFDERRKVVLSLSYNSLMMLAAAFLLGTSTRFMQLSYLDHGGKDGELEVFQSEIFATVSAFLLLTEVSLFLIQVLNPIMQLWRAWVIWATSPYRFIVVIFPSFLVIAGLSLNIAILIVPIKPDPKLAFALITAQAALDVANSVLVTLLLVGRIIMVRSRHLRLMGTSFESSDNQYTSIVAMLIESFALDAAWTTASVISYALATEGDPTEVYQIFNNTGDQVTVMAFLLVTYRVLLGRAWTTETGQQLSTLRWNHDGPGSEDTTTTSMNEVTSSHSPSAVSPRDMYGDVGGDSVA